MKLRGNSIVFENGFTIDIQRTVRLPEDGKTHALPPGFGSFPVRRVEDYKDKVPGAWNKHQGVFIPMYEREAMWLNFSGPTSAVKVASGKVNAVSGKTWTPELQQAEARRTDSATPVQDYMVAPDPQRWLDGFNTGEGQVRQFVAMQMGKGYTVEGQVTGKEDVGGIQILVVPSKPGRVKERTVTRGAYLEAFGMASMDDDGGLESFNPGSSLPLKSASLKSMGLAQGAQLNQEIFEDPHGLDVWDQANAERLFIHIVDAAFWEKVTGEPCPGCPIPASEYKGSYFDYTTDGTALKGSGILSEVKTVSQKDKQHGFVDQQDDSPLDETKTNGVVDFSTSKNKIKDGTW